MIPDGISEHSFLLPGQEGRLRASMIQKDLSPLPQTFQIQHGKKGEKGLFEDLEENVWTR